MATHETDLAGVHFVHDDWRDLAFAVEFSPGDDAAAIRRRFKAAATKAVQVADLLAQDRAAKAATNIIQFPLPGAGR